MEGLEDCYSNFIHSLSIIYSMALLIQNCNEGPTCGVETSVSHYQSYSVLEALQMIPTRKTTRAQNNTTISKGKLHNTSIEIFQCTLWQEC